LKEVNLTQGLEQGVKRLLPPQDKRLAKNKKEKIKTSGKNTYAQDLKQSEKTRSLPRTRD
jgi:hypothetical protein